MSLTPGGILAASCFTRGFSEINKFVLTQLPFKLFLLPWVSKLVRCVCVCVHMCAPFNSPLALRSYLPGAHHPVEGTQVGSPLWGWSPQSLGIASAIVIILPFVGCLLRSLGLDFPVFLPFLPILWFLFYIFNCGSFLLSSKLLSLTVSL